MPAGPNTGTARPIADFLELYADYKPAHSSNRQLNRDVIETLRAVIAFTPQMYGAKGDFVADDGPAVTAAVEAAYAVYVALGIMQWVYLPPGIYRLATVAVDGYTLVKSRPGVSVFGPGTLKVGNAVRTLATGIGVLYNHTDPISNVIYTGFTVDFNGQNNLNLEAAGGHTLTANVNRLGAGNSATNVTVDGVTFKNAQGHHFVFFDGGGKKVKITGCTFDECGSSIAGSGDSDHSSIYLNVPDSDVYDNHFINANPDIVATAIEVHGSDIRVHDNDGVNYHSVGNICAQVASASTIDWHDNTFRTVLNGVVFWTSGAFLLSAVRAHDNTIGLREATGGLPPGRGFYAATTTMASSANSTGLTLHHNEIFCETLAQLAMLTVGIDISRWNDVTVDGNRLHDIMAEALVVQSENAPNRTLSRVTVINNEVRDCGLTSTVANKRAMAFTSFANLAAALDTVTIRGNNFSASAAPAGGTTATCALEFTTGWFPNTRIINNPMSGFTGASPIKKGTVDAANLFLVIGEGAYEPFNNIKASLGSEWTYTGASPFKKSVAAHTPSDGNSDVWRVVNNDRISADNGDNAKVLVDGDEQFQYWNTPLTANRAVTLPAATQANNGRKFTIRRGLNATGAFNLNIGGGAAVLNAAGQTATFISNGAAYFLVQ